MEMEATGSKCSRNRKSLEAAAQGHGPVADRISDLPDGVFGDIISLLPTKEGARTQVLASRWRHLWRSAPLNLHYRPLLLGKEGLNATISRILAAHRGPGRRFCAPVYNLAAGRADAWLRSPALDNLQELELCSFEYNILSPFALKPPPAAAFRFSDTLRVATIGDCHLADSTVQALHFPKLQKLALKKVRISECSLHIMIAACPALECLLIYHSSGFRCVRINSIGIRIMGVKSFAYYDRWPRFEELIIQNAPCLESLLQLGSSDGLHVSGLRVDSLTTVVRTIKILAVDMHALSLDDVLDLMGCFPCLEKLYIQSTGRGKTNCWHHKHQTLVRSLDIRLKKIVWRYYLGIKSHVDFANFFVLNAGVLELMTFEVNHDDYNEAFFCTTA